MATVFAISEEYGKKAEQARSRPGVWVNLRSGMATANLVTEIRQGRWSRVGLNPDEFEAKSY
ncbi:hypothetical protein ACFVU2_21320, partial [Leifsonia sp. NPDC058194]|uniref:hypothetical protein n=1 Tax=Leifsonia sp. NPDC058194 TaxID=3346374 RepID=UPI0036D80CAC